MSSKRYLLIFAILIVALAIQAKTQAFLRSDLAVSLSGDYNQWMMNNRLGYALFPLDGFEFAVEADLSWADRYQENRKQKLYNGLQSALTYTGKLFRAGAYYRNTIYGSPVKLALYPTLDPLRVYEKSVQHHSALFAEMKHERIDLRSYALQKNLGVTPWDFDFSSFELVEKDRTYLKDQYFGISTAVKLNDMITLHAGGDHKDAAFADDGQFELTSYGGGLGLTHRFTPLSNAEAVIIWKTRNGNAIESQRRNHLQTTLRYRQRFSHQLSGFILFVNNSALNSDLDNLRLISNYLRGHILYTLPYDKSNDSYLLLGLKYSPENEADAYFFETRERIWRGLYGGAEVNIHPDRLNVYQIILAYRISPLAEVETRYSYRDPANAAEGISRVGIGTSLYW